MKKLILTLFGIILITTLHAQNFEFSEGINTGLFHYGGSGSAASSYIFPVEGNGQYRTNNPYGNVNGFSYGAYTQLQYVTKGGFIIGSQLGYDLLRSKVNITGLIPFEVYFNPNVLLTDQAAESNGPNNASGHTYLQSELINFSPYIGYRLKEGKVNIDLMPGVDIGFHINSYDKGTATTTYASAGAVYNDTSDYNLGKAPTDIRIKFGVAAGYGRSALNVSYAHGLTKQLPYLYSASSGDYVHSELLRMGISYRIK